MTIPTYEDLMLPVLSHSGERLWTVRELVDRIANDLRLTQDEREKLLPSGGTNLFFSRVSWAKTYLKKAGLVEQPKRGTVQITARGRQILAENLQNIDSTVLMRFPEFIAFQRKTKINDRDIQPGTSSSTTISASATPEEQITLASETLDISLRDALLARVLEAKPAFFEKLIIDLLLAMGYGGSRTDAGEQLGGTGDGGVDGVIREDQLGLDRIYLQAKRYQPGNTVGSEAVQAFIGALVGKGAQKGVFITTSTFSKAAKNAASQSGQLRLVLIDGEELTGLMLRFNVGSRVARTIALKRVDLDYFEEAEPE